MKKNIMKNYKTHINMQNIHDIINTNNAVRTASHPGIPTLE